MILGIGIDLIEVRRVREAIERFGERFLRRLFTSVEIEYCSPKKNAALHYAGRFAAKEAAFKAMRRGWGGDLGWKDVEVYNEATGAPQIRFHGKALEIVLAMKMLDSHVSLSHIQDYATAIVILES